MFKARLSAGMACDTVPKEHFSVYVPNLLQKIFGEKKKRPHKITVCFLNPASESSTCLMHTKVLLSRRNRVLPKLLLRADFVLRVCSVQREEEQ